MYSINGRSEFYIQSALYAGSGAGGREGGTRDDTCGVIRAEVINGVLKMRVCQALQDLPDRGGQSLSRSEGASEPRTK